MSDVLIIEELREEIESLRGKVSALLTFGSAKVCKSCAKWYPQGFICRCGRDNTYSNEEWAELVGKNSATPNQNNTGE